MCTKSVAETFRRSLLFGVKDENIGPYHVGPYCLFLVATVLAALTPVFTSLPFDTPPLDHFSGEYAVIFFWTWVALAMVCPLLVMVSYWLPGVVNDSRYFAIWLRFGGDVGQLFVLLALEVVTFQFTSVEAVYRQTLFLGYVIFTLLMATRDVFLIVATERLAGQIEHDKCSEGQD